MYVCTQYLNLLQFKTSSKSSSIIASRTFESKKSNQTQEPQYAHVSHVTYTRILSARKRRLQNLSEHYNLKLVIGQLTTSTDSVGLPRSQRPHSAAAAAAAGCDVAGLAASDTAGLDVHYFKHLQEIQCLVVEFVSLNYALL